MNNEHKVRYRRGKVRKRYKKENTGKDNKTQFLNRLRGKKHKKLRFFIVVKPQRSGYLPPLNLSGFYIFSSLFFHKKELWIFAKWFKGFPPTLDGPTTKKRSLRLRGGG